MVAVFAPVVLDGSSPVAHFIHVALEGPFTHRFSALFAQAPNEIRSGGVVLPIPQAGVDVVLSSCDSAVAHDFSPGSGK
jgi:hypothetical protein